MPRIDVVMMVVVVRGDIMNMDMPMPAWRVISLYTLSRWGISVDPPHGAVVQ